MAARRESERECCTGVLQETIHDVGGGANLDGISWNQGLTLGTFLWVMSSPATTERGSCGCFINSWQLIAEYR